MLKSLQISGLSILLVLLSCALGSAQQAEADDPDVARVDKVVDRLWWNNSKHVEALGLTPEVRSKMDQIARDFLGESNLNDQLDLQRQVAEALVEGDWQAAEARAEELAKAVADPVRRQVKLKTEVARLLTPEQRRQIYEQHPRLMARAWVRMSVGPRGGGPRRGQ